MKMRAFAIGALCVAAAAMAAVGQTRPGASVTMSAPIKTAGEPVQLRESLEAVRQPAQPVAAAEPAALAPAAAQPERKVRVILSSPYGSSEQ